MFTGDTGLEFLTACPNWMLLIHATLARTGLRVGELVRLPIEDVDLAGG